MRTGKYVEPRTLEGLIATALATPSRNIYGTIGPRCHPCSGLGSTLVLKDSPGFVAKSLTRCQCEGSGLDLPRIERMDRELMWKRMRELELKMNLKHAERFKFKNSRQTWEECVSWMTADGTAVANTTTETILVPNITIPSGYMSGGRALQGKIQGKWSTTTGTVTHVYKVRWGGVAGTVLGQTGTVTLVVSITNAAFEITFELQTRTDDTTGGIGVFMPFGKSVTYGGTAPTVGSATGAPAIAPITSAGQTAPATVSSLTLNADTALAVTVTHGAASSSNTITALTYWLNSKN